MSSLTPPGAGLRASPLGGTSEGPPPTTPYHHEGTRTETGEEYFEEEPYYEPVGDEIAIVEAAYRNQLPVLLKGPTGCGKTRFMEHMGWRLKRPLITVPCHDDLTASDLVGRYLVTGGETVWVDGPLARAVRSGSICYLDEMQAVDELGASVF
jgi:nitric oxide reductase NorQ protein